MRVWTSKAERRLQAIEARLDRHDAEMRAVAGDVAGIEETMAALRKRIEALEAEQKRVEPCPK